MTKLNYAKHQPTRRRIMLKITVLFVAVALTATAQIPMHRPIGECSTVDAVEDDGNDNANVAQSEFVIPPDIVIGISPGTLCSFYAIAGWESPLKLHLGEGASEYRELIERAVEVWNETVRLPSREPLIEIIETRPTNYLLQSSFWSNTSEYGLENLEDDESVIYFKPSGEDETSRWGLAWSQWSRSSMIQADVYINTADEESRPGRTLILTKKLVDVDSLYGAYALYNKTYSVILHELGHAVGLNHIPVSGNIMSKDFGGGGIDQWSAAMALELFSDSFPRQNRFVKRDSQIVRYMSLTNSVHTEALELVEFFTQNAKLGEQEKMALTCIYEY